MAAGARDESIWPHDVPLAPSLERLDFPSLTCSKTTAARGKHLLRAFAAAFRSRAD